MLRVDLTVDCDVLATHLVLITIGFWGVESPVYDCTFWKLLAVARVTAQRNSIIRMQLVICFLTKS